MISPPTWGWPVLAADSGGNHRDFPTHVGMARVARGDTT